MKKFISYLLGMTLGALAILPPFVGWTLEVPVLVNSFLWVYFIVFSGLLIAYFCLLDAHILVKIMACYLYVSCFFSAAPYISFNAMLTLVPCLYLYLLIKKYVDVKTIINWVTAIFWLEVFVFFIQLFGKDTLMNFDRPQNVVLGTVFQHMRFGSLLAILSPFLLLKSKWYIIPLAVMAFFTKSSSFALALFAGMFVYMLLNKNILKKYKLWAISIIVVLAIGHSFYNNGSFKTAISIGRVPAWTRIVGTWTGAHYHLSKIATRDAPAVAAVNMLKGRGLNLFPYLYPVLVEDANPFAQVHNDWLQFLWELGLIGLFIALTYWLLLIAKLRKHKKNIWLAGLVMAGVNMFFAFPCYMPPQTPLLILCFLALSEKEAYVSK